jgi:superfamily II DNA or RNA helicase
MKKNSPDFAKRLELLDYEALKNFKAMHTNSIHDLPIKWRDVQVEAITAASRALLGSFAISMGVGKSHTMGAIAHLCSENGQNVLFLAPTLKLRDNFYDVTVNDCKLGNVLRYEKIRGKYDTSNLVNMKGKIIIASGDMLVNDLNNGSNFLENIHTLITDETHSFTNPSWNVVLYNLPNAYRHYGFSATPILKKEVDKTNINQLTKKSAHVVNATSGIIFTAEEQSSGKYTDVPELHNIAFEWTDEDIEESMEDKSWATLYKYVTNLEGRNLFLSDLLRELQKLNRVIVVPINNKKHVRLLLELLDSNKAIANFGNGKAHDYQWNMIDSDDIEDNFNSGKYDVMFATSHIDAGFDLPVLDVVLYVEGKDDIAIVQKSGRIIRPSEDTPLIINVFDNQPVLESQSKKREKHVTEYYKIKTNNHINISEFIKSIK